MKEKEFLEEVQMIIKKNATFLDEDEKQDLLIKLWKAQKSYDKEKGTILNWTLTAIKRYEIDMFKKKISLKKNEVTPFSSFEYMSNEYETYYSYELEKSLIDNKANVEDNYILQEDILILKEKIEYIPERYRNFIQEYLNGDIVINNSTNKTLYRRALKAIKEAKIKKNYNLLIKETNENKKIIFLKDAADIIGKTPQAISRSMKIKRFFENKNYKLTII